MTSISLSHTPRIDLSYVVPVLNEESNIRAAYTAIKNAFAFSNLRTFEIVFVDDGSSDNTLSIIKELVESDASVKCISLTRNYGHQAALSAGLAYSKGDYIERRPMEWCNSGGSAPA